MNLYFLHWVGTFLMLMGFLVTRKKTNKKKERKRKNEKETENEQKSRLFHLFFLLSRRNFFSFFSLIFFFQKSKEQQRKRKDFSVLPFSLDFEISLFTELFFSNSMLSTMGWSLGLVGMVTCYSNWLFGSFDPYYWESWVW